MDDLSVLKGVSKSLRQRLAQLNWAEQQRIVLTKNLILLSLVIDLILFFKFFVFEKSFCGTTAALILLGLSFLAATFLFTGYWHVSKILIAITANVAVFYLALTNPVESGAYILYIPNTIAAYLIFSNRQRTMSLLFSVMPLFFFFLSLSMQNGYSSDYMNEFLFHFVSAVICIILQMLFLIHFYHKSEQKSFEKENYLGATIENLNALSNDMDRLIYSSSHDLRSPIASIKGLVNLMKINNPALDMCECLDRVDTSVRKMDSIITSLKYYAENRNSEIRFSTVDLKSMLDEVLGEVGDISGTRTQIINDVLPQILTTDADRLKSAIKQIITNAIFFSNPSKANHFVMLRSSIANGHIHLVIQDTGVGIAKEQLDKVFDMFYRGSETSDGSGLGLFLARASLARIGWSIRISSVVNQGTIVTVSSPLANVETVR